MSIRVEIDTSGLDERRRAFEQRAREAVNRQLRRYQAAVGRAMQKSAPRKDGALAAATVAGGKGNVSEITIQAGDMTLTHGIDARMLPYVAIQDTGGVIKAKGEYLTVPVSDEARKRLKAAGGARNIPGLFVVTSKKGNLILAEQDGDGINPIAVLKRQVTIPGSRWFQFALREIETTAALDLADDLSEDLAAVWNAI